MVAFLRKRQVWVPTVWGWLALLVVVAAAVWIAAANAYDFLAPVDPARGPDGRGARILVRAPASFDLERGDWVKIQGILVPETRVGDSVLYDVVTADEISRAREPRFRNLF